MHNMLCCCRPCTQRRHLQLISDYFEGAFAAAVPWTSFTLRFPEAEVGSRNLTRELLAAAADVTRLRQLQSNLQMYARDVLWEAPDSRAGVTRPPRDHALRRLPPEPPGRARPRRSLRSGTRPRAAGDLHVGGVTAHGSCRGTGSAPTVVCTMLACGAEDHCCVSSFRLSFLISQFFFLACMTYLWRVLSTFRPAPRLHPR